MPYAGRVIFQKAHLVFLWTQGREIWPLSLEGLVNRVLQANDSSWRVYSLQDIYSQLLRWTDD